MGVHELRLLPGGTVVIVRPAEDVRVIVMRIAVLMRMDVIVLVVVGMRMGSMAMRMVVVMPRRSGLHGLAEYPQANACDDHTGGDHEVWLHLFADQFIPVQKPENGKDPHNKGV